MKYFLQKFFLGGCFFSLAFFLFSTKISAHILQIDDNIGAVMHTDPNDDPIAGQPTGFFFAFKDKQNKFQPVNCDCTFAISENGKEIFSQPLFQNNQNPSLDNASVFYTFPERAVYQVKIIGKPLQENGFQPFTLTYNVRVERVSETKQNSNEPNNFPVVVVVLIGVVAVTVVGCALLWRKRKRKS